MIWLECRLRATRFPITTALLFRWQGEPDWHRASTLNMSHSGVLFRTEDSLPQLGQRVEFIVRLPLGGVEQAPEVRCTGRVVRIAAEVLAGGGRAAAMTIESHEFEGRAGFEVGARSRSTS